MTTLDQAKPLFHRDDIKELIVRIGKHRRLIVYAGAGVTIDRSGLGWNDLVSGLLENYIADPKQRKTLLSHLSGLQGASVAAQMYHDDHGDVDYRDRLTDRLRVMLYNSGDWAKGRLAQNLAELVTVLNLRAMKGGEDRGSCIVTPNYDAYLHEELINLDQLRSKRRGPRSRPALLFPTAEDTLSRDADNRLEAWVDDPSFPNPGMAACIHLHGYVPRSATGPFASSYRHPVVSEQDYLDSERASFEALRSLLTGTPLLIVGASMTDPPLLRALAATKREENDRYALVPLPSLLSVTERAALQRNIQERYEHFGVRAIFLDYYGQIQQFVREVTTVASLPSPYDYLSHTKNVRYGRRLSFWWGRWRKSVAAWSEDPQYLVHQTLDIAKLALSSIVRAAPSEIFKLELWLRWEPETQRQLNLWASSVGSWVDEESMRIGPIELDSEYQAVRAFVAGTPTFHAMPESQSPSQRWRTYLSIPLYWKAAKHGELAVGVLTIASMSDASDSALNPALNKSRLIEAIQFAEALGQELIEPSPDRWDKYLEQLLAELDFIEEDES